MNRLNSRSGYRSRWQHHKHCLWLLLLLFPKVGLQILLKHHGQICEIIIRLYNYITVIAWLFKWINYLFYITKYKLNFVSVWFSFVATDTLLYFKHGQTSKLIYGSDSKAGLLVTYYTVHLCAVKMLTAVKWRAWSWSTTVAYFRVCPWAWPPFVQETFRCFITHKRKT